MCVSYVRKKNMLEVMLEVMFEIGLSSHQKAKGPEPYGVLMSTTPFGGGFACG